MSRARLGRRTVVTAVAGVLLAGCGRDGAATLVPGQALGAPTVHTLTPGPPAGALAPASLPPAEPWVPSGREVEPEAKIAAVRVVEALGSTGTDGASVRQRLARIGADPRLAGAGAPLVPPSTSGVTHVVYPQYGGLTDRRASVMVVAEQSWVTEVGLARRTLTADVRVRREGSSWRVEDVLVPSAADPVRVDDAVPRLLAEPNVELPHAAASDLAGGQVDRSVVEALLTLSASYRLSVSVFRSGHPEEVFGTGTTSNHTRGRAVDIWAVDGTPVVSMRRDDPVLTGFLDAARATGSDEVGGPVDRDGPGGAHFANALHRDHVHIGFD
ncbi:hypothetical protein ACOACO_03570 [Nocardioides sp. CPCC 205120]|uniref:hypothetical protein n=1 Tax=Nocardioides sp. CPCC 205120 TaxID=3406462 RepID=UPI003B50F922